MSCLRGNGCIEVTFASAIGLILRIVPKAILPKLQIHYPCSSEYPPSIAGVPVRSLIRLTTLRRSIFCSGVNLVTRWSLNSREHVRRTAAETFITKTHAPVEYLELFLVRRRLYIVDWLPRRGHNIRSSHDIGSTSGRHSTYPLQDGKR